MYRRFKNLDREKRIGLVIIVIWILGWSLLIGLQISQNKSTALGGGFYGPSSHSVTVNATTNAVVLGANILQTEVKGNYIVLGITTFAPGITVSSIADTASDSYVKAISSARYEYSSIYYANYTGTNFAANTITVTFSASTTSTVRANILSGVVTGSIQTSSGNGTATTATVTSFTPNTNFACYNFIGLDSGSATLTAFTTPNFWFGFEAGKIITTFDIGVNIENNWASYGATTIATPFTPSVSPQWDDVAACFPQGPATSTTSTTTTTTTSTTTSTTTTTNITKYTGQATVTAVTGASTITTTATNTTTLSTKTTTIFTGQATVTKATTNATTTILTTTGNVTTTVTAIPEPIGSTDLLLILLAIIIFLILMVIGLIKRNPFPILLGAVVLLIMNVGLYTNNTIIYGNNSITTPLWVNEMITILVIAAFVLVIYQIIQRRR